MSNELSLSDFSEHIQKGFKEYDLQKSDGWKTINGAKVFFEGGKAKYGAESLKEHVNGKSSNSSDSSDSKGSKSEGRKLEGSSKSIFDSASKKNPYLANKESQVYDLASKIAKVNGESNSKPELEHIAEAIQYYSQPKDELLSNISQDILDSFKSSLKLNDGGYLDRLTELGIANESDIVGLKEAKDFSKKLENKNMDESAKILLKTAMDRLTDEDVSLKNFSDFGNEILSSANGKGVADIAEAINKTSKSHIAVSNLVKENEKKAKDFDKKLQSKVESVKKTIDSKMEDKLDKLGFSKMAKKYNNVPEFMDAVRKVKNVPSAVSKYFMETYGKGGLSMEETAKVYMESQKQ